MSDCTDTSVLPTQVLQYSSTVLKYLCTACTQSVKNVNDITRQVEQVEQEIIKRAMNKVALKKRLQSNNRIIEQLDKDDNLVAESAHTEYISQLDLKKYEDEESSIFVISGEKNAALVRAKGIKGQTKVRANQEKKGNGHR